MSNIGQ